MVDTTRWVWTISLVLLLLYGTVNRSYLVLPWFSLYLGVTAAQTLFHFHNVDADNSWWIPWAIATTVLKGASVAEVLEKRSRGMRYTQIWIGAAASIIYGTVYLCARVRSDHPWIEAAMIFRHIESGTLFFLISGIWITYVWSPWPYSGETSLVEVGFVRQHSWILITLLLSRVVGALVYETLPPRFTTAGWMSIQLWTYLAATVCFWLWIRMICYPLRSLIWRA